MKVEVYTTYSYCNCTEVELPEDKSFDDIKDVGMKWGHGEIEFNDGSILEFEEDFIEELDSKRPEDIRLEKEDGTDFIDYCEAE